jgi:hypothetical protein
MRFFKRQAPNDMKKEDLYAKSWIITDPRRALHTLPVSAERMRLCEFVLSCCMAVVEITSEPLSPESTQDA